MPKKSVSQPDANGANEVRVFAAAIRPSARVVAPKLALFIGAAWLVAWPIVTFMTAWGAAEHARLGLAGWSFSWALVAALAVLGTVAAYAAVTRLAQGTVAYSERRVVRLGYGDAFLSMAGGFACTFLPITFMSEVMIAATLVVIIGFFFAAAVLLPMYIANWQRAVAEGRSVSDR